MFKQQQPAVPAPGEGQDSQESANSAVCVGSRDSAASAALNGSAAESRVAPSAASVPAGATPMATDHGEEAPPAGEADSDSDGESAPVLRTELSVEAKAKESELRAYLLDHRRRMEGGTPHQKVDPSQVDPALDPAPEDEVLPDAEPTGAEAAIGDAKKDDGGGFDMFNDDVEEVDVPEEVLDEAAAMDRGDNYDDKEGYYAHRIGDLLNDRYKILGTCGKGVFSTVVRCQDLRAPPGTFLEVAVKVQRNNEMMRRAGEKEIMYLQRLVEGDPDNKRHCIHMFDRFDHEDHLCMVFEAMHQNLRQALRQHGHKRGIQLDAVKIYARQLFVALRYMERLNIMHADLKPDNIVVNDKYNLLKVCDFGSAANGDDNEITPYLVSRFYRAPEIMLGLHYGCPVDMWAAGCTLYELYTGKIMFQGNSNNMMLKLIQEVKGKMPHKLIRKGFFSELHFDPDNDFVYKEKDKVSGREIVRTIKFEQRPTAGKDLRNLLMPTKLPESEAKKVLQLADLLEKALMLDPSKRLSPSQALKHPFCDLTRK